MHLSRKRATGAAATEPPDPIARAALSGDYATVLRLARRHRGWTQKHLAEKIGYTPGVISRLENRRQPLTDVCLLRQLARLLDTPESMFGLTESSLTVDPTRHKGDEDVRRRKMLTAAGLVLAGVKLGLPAVEMPRRVSIDHVRQVRRFTDQYRNLIYQRGAGRPLRDAITGLLDHCTGLISHVSTESLRRDLLDAMGDLGGLAAYAYRDLGAHDLAQQHYLLAIQAAKAAGDRSLTGHLVVRMAGQHIELAQPDEVQSYLHAARHTGTVFSPGESSNQCAIAAWAHAQTGNYQAVRRSAGLAEEYFARRDSHAGTPHDRGWQLRHTAESELFSLTGAAFAELAQHEARHAPEAIVRLTRALELRGPGFARNATLDKISLAEAHLAARNLDQAARHATEATRMASDSPSCRVRARLDGLMDLLRPHQNRADVADTLERAGRL